MGSSLIEGSEQEFLTRTIIYTFVPNSLAKYVYRHNPGT